MVEKLITFLGGFSTLNSTIPIYLFRHVDEL